MGACGGHARDTCPPTSTRSDAPTGGYDVPDRYFSGTLEMSTSRQDFKLPLEIQVGKDTCWFNPAVFSG